MQCWNIGNTTVRNPLRIEEGLIAFESSIAGKKWEKPIEYQKKFYDVLLESGLIKSTSENEQDSLGRKWLACFKQLGFIQVDTEKNILTLTGAGLGLINNTLPAEDIFLKQLMKLKLPNYLENGASYEEINVHPFWLTIKCLYLLQNNHNAVGLNKNEIALYLIPCIQNSDLESAIASILLFRKGYGNAKGMVAKHQFIKDQYNKIADDRDLVKLASLKDYADSSLRYFLRSGLFTIKGTRVEIETHKMKLAKFVIENALSVSERAEEDAYIDIYTSLALPELPYLEKSYLSEILSELSQSAANEGVDIRAIDLNQSVSELRKAQIEIENEIVLKREIKFMSEQRNKLDEIGKNFELIKNKTFLGGDMYAPAFYEWNTWRVFLAIDDFNSEVSDTRGFKVDSEINPIHHAKGGYADMEFEYDEKVLVVECTLSTGQNQWNMEREPVMRHVQKAINKSTKEVVGIFVAPKIDLNTYHSFLNESLYLNVDDEQPTRINVVPLTDNQLKNLMNKHDFSAGHSHLLNQINTILEARDRSDNNARKWSMEIEEVLSK